MKVLIFILTYSFALHSYAQMLLESSPFASNESTFKNFIKVVVLNRKENKKNKMYFPSLEIHSLPLKTSKLLYKLDSKGFKDSNGKVLCSPVLFPAKEMYGKELAQTFTSPCPIMDEIMTQSFELAGFFNIYFSSFKRNPDINVYYSGSGVVKHRGTEYLVKILDNGDLEIGDISTLDKSSKNADYHFDPSFIKSTQRRANIFLKPYKEKGSKGILELMTKTQKFKWKKDEVELPYIELKINTYKQKEILALDSQTAAKIPELNKILDIFNKKLSYVAENTPFLIDAAKLWEFDIQKRYISFQTKKIHSLELQWGSKSTPFYMQFADIIKLKITLKEGLSVSKYLNTKLKKENKSCTRYCTLITEEAFNKRSKKK